VHFSLHRFKHRLPWCRPLLNASEVFPRDLQKSCGLRDALHCRVVEAIRWTVFLAYKLVLSDNLQFNELLGLNRVLHKVLIGALFCFFDVSVDVLGLDDRFLVGQAHPDGLPEFTLSHDVNKLSRLVLPVQKRVNQFFYRCEVRHYLPHLALCESPEKRQVFKLNQQLWLASLLIEHE